MAFDFFWKNHFVAIPTVVELSTWIVVGTCLHPISVRMVQIGTAVCALTKMVLYSSSAADTMMLRMILHITSMIPLTVGTKSSGFLGLVGPSLRKWTPLARLLTWENERYNASECMDNFIPLSLYWISMFELESKQFRRLATCFDVLLVALDWSEEI